MSKINNIYFVIIFFVIMGFLFNYFNPLWCSPDEERHFGYCEYLAQKGRLPAYTADTEQYSLNMGFHPPLYYFLTSFFCSKDTIQLKDFLVINDAPGYQKIVHPRTGSGLIYPEKVRSAYSIRAFSILLSLITLFLIYRLALIVLPGEPAVAAACALFVATIPQFQQVATSVSNQSLMMLVSTSFITCLVHYINSPEKWRWKTGAGFFLGLCFLTRSAAVLFIPLTLCAVIWVWFRNRKNPLIDGMFILGLGFVMAGWWYVRNYIVYGDPLLSKAFMAQQPWISQEVPITLDYFLTVLYKTYTSFFGALGSTRIHIPLIHNAVYGLLLLLAAAGSGVFLLRFKNTTLFQRQALGLLLLALAGAAAQYTMMNLQYFGMYLGRYFFIVIAPFAVILFSGLYYLLPDKARNGFFSGLSIILIALNLYVCFMVLRPAYADTQLEEKAAQNSFCCTTPSIDTTVTIGQRFVVSANNLCAVRVLFAREKPKHGGEILFTLRQGSADGSVLYRLSYPLEKISDSQRLVFIFPPIRESAGKEYVASFSSSAAQGQGIQLWYEAADKYPNGSLLVNGKPAEGDLYFSAYCFAGETPRTIWQGKEKVVLNQDNFIRIGELQFYLDLTPERRKQTVTHEKLAIIKAAIQKRKEQ